MAFQSGVPALSGRHARCSDRGCPGFNFWRCLMAGISNEQQQQDMKSLTRFLVIFNLALFGIFLTLCFYRNV
jgi:hypothetical protein